MDNRIRELRKAKGITMKQLGVIIGVAESTISHYETGKRQLDKETLIKLSNYFGVTIGFLLGAEEDSFQGGAYKDWFRLYISANTAERIKMLAKSKGIVIKDMLEECELGKNTLSSMLSRGSWLQANNLAKIADYLGCSVDYLLGRTEKIPADQTVSGLTKERQALMDLVIACPEDLAKDLLIAMQLFLQNWQR